jgi:tRNA threonylcarbamoyladenosine biosynthesis protein TsaE
MSSEERSERSPHTRPPTGRHESIGMIEHEVSLPTRRATKLLARAIVREIAPGDLFVLSGPLGAGKTFLVRAMCRAVGLDRSFSVTSPTFTLVHEYPTLPPVLHVDCYRLESQDDVASLGLLEQRDAGKVLLVEWGEPFIDVLGGDAIVVELEVSPRRARIRGTGPRSAFRVDRLG